MLLVGLDANATLSHARIKLDFTRELHCQLCLSLVAALALSTHAAEYPYSNRKISSDRHLAPQLYTLVSCAASSVANGFGTFKQHWPLQPVDLHTMVKRRKPGSSKGLL